MPSKLFGQYKEEQVQQINYLPYTAKMAEMLVQGAGNLASGIAEGVKQYKANEDLSEFNKTQTKTLAPILENLRADASKSKELESYVPEIDAQIKALSESNGKSPKVAASVVAGVGAYLKGFNDRFDTQQKMRNVAVAGDIATNYTSTVDTVEPAEVGADAVDYNPDLNHWQNISAFDKYLTSAEEQAKGKGVTVDRKLATINWLKSKKNFIENNEIPNLSPEKRQRLLEVLSNEIDNMDAGEYAGGEAYNPETSPDAKFTINDVNGNPVNVSLPAKGEPVSNASGVSSATLTPSSQPQGTPVSPSVAPSIAPQKVSTSEVATSAPVIPSAKAQPATTGTQGMSWMENGNLLKPEETRKILQEYNVNLSKWNNPETKKGFDSFSDYVVSIKQLAQERANQIVMNSPAGYERFDPYNPKKELKEVEGGEPVQPVISKVPNAEGNWETVDLTAPTKKKEPVIDYIKNAFGQGEKSSKTVNPMSGGGKMAMIPMMGLSSAPAKAEPKKVEAISTKNLSPEARDAHYVKKANEGMVQNQWRVVGATTQATKWADGIQKDIDENGFEASSIDYNAYGAWQMKNPNKADILSAGGTVLSFFVPVGRALKIAGNLAKFDASFGATAWNSKVGRGIIKASEKIFKDGAGKITQAEALAQAQTEFKAVKEAARLAMEGGWTAQKYDKLVTGISSVAGGAFASMFAADNDFAMPNFDEVLSGENSQPELKQKTEKLIDDIGELRQGGFKGGMEALGIVKGWDDKTDAEKYAINLKISDKIAKYKKEVADLGETSKTRARALQANPLSKQDIIDNKVLSTQTATQVAKVDTRVGAIKTEGRINVGEREYKKQLDIQEKKDNLKKFMVQKYGYVPSGFDSMYKTMHPEDEFNTMEVNGVGYYHNGKVWSPVPVEKGETKSMKQRAEDSAFVFGHQDARGNLIPQEFEVDSGVRLRGLFRGTQKQLEEFTTNYGNLLSSKKVVNRLIEINDMNGESMIWNADLKGEAMAKISELKSNYRTEIIGVGTVSNYEQELINDVISNPTTFFSLESSDRAKLLAILQRTDDRLKRLPSRYNLEVSFVEKKEDKEKNLNKLYNSSSKKSAKQLEWEKNHPELSSLDVKGVKRSVTLPEESK